VHPKKVKAGCNGRGKDGGAKGRVRQQEGATRRLKYQTKGGAGTAKKIKKVRKRGGQPQKTQLGTKGGMRAPTLGEDWSQKVRCQKKRGNRAHVLGTREIVHGTKLSA